MTHALGRKVEHDPRSLAYKVRATGEVRSARWERVAPILDQGNVGACTGFAAAGVLGTKPSHWEPITDQFALQLYMAATKLDSFPGEYPPDDTGSSGLAVAKACQAIGAISGYKHITSLTAAHTAIQAGPFIVGSNWYESMFTPAGDFEDQPKGFIDTPQGQVAGGHEYECLGYDAAAGLWRFANSWGDGWGDKGYFSYTDATFAKLLAEDGDATVFVPITEPAPTPDQKSVDVQLLDAWAAKRHYAENGRAARAWQRVRATL